MSVFDWPANLIPADIQVDPPSKTAGLTTSISEIAQAVPVIRPPFALKLQFGVLIGGKVLSWRAAIARFEGRANTARIPLFDLWYRARDEQIGAGGVPHSDGTPFSDGALYLTDDLVGVTVTGVQGQRVITADFGDYGQLLQAGLYFGLAERPYIARGVWWEGSVARIECSPTLRRDYTDEPLKLKPTMLGRLTEDKGGQLMLRRGRYGGPTLELVEDFRPGLDDT